jgi:hypothetical protein
MVKMPGTDFVVLKIFSGKIWRKNWRSLFNILLVFAKFVSYHIITPIFRQKLAKNRKNNGITVDPRPVKNFYVLCTRTFSLFEVHFTDTLQNVGTNSGSTYLWV